MLAHILVVEDDRHVAEGLRDIFAAQGYQVTLAETAREALAAVQTKEIDLAVLDIALGPDSGYDLCLQIRGFCELPILFLTACNSELELLRGFQCGGDDYLTKPFRMQELLVRVQALLRRGRRPIQGPLYAGDLEIDADKRFLKKEGLILGLSGVEWKILHALLARYPRTLSRGELLHFVWDKDAAFVEANTLNVNISRLREKLGSWQDQPYIETVRSVGYRWAVAPKR